MIRRFISYYRPHLRLFLLDLAAALLFAACNLVYPTVSRTILNDLIPARELSLIFVFAAVLVGIYLLKTGLNYFMSRFGHYVGAEMQADMRRDLFQHMERLPCSFFDDHKTGDLMSRMTNDLFNVAELAHHGPEDLLISVLQLVGSFILMAVIDVRLALIACALVPLMVLFAALKRKKMKAAFKKSREEIAEINAGLENSISGIRVSKAYTSQEVEEAGFAVANRRFLASRRGAYDAMAEYHAGLGLCTDMLNIVVLIAGALFVFYGKIGYGDLVAFLLYVGIFLQPITKLVSFVEQLQDGMTGFGRFVEIMDTPVEEDDAGAEDVTDVRGEIELLDVSFGYGEAEVLSGVSVRIEAGKTLALVGPSGGGKTTLCHLLPRFYDVDSGKILLDGRDIRTITLASLRRSIGIVAQDVFLFNSTIAENIRYGKPDATEEEVVNAARLAGIDAYVSTLPKGYDTPVGERGVKLSGGQKQRIAIARAFLKDPKILILDEATSALDNVTEAMIQKSLARLSAGRTVIVVAHRLSTVRRADEILYIDHEGIRERGTHEELLRKGGLYASLSQGLEE
ncbi:MAG: ABC transporter ATP-binding protein [Clostridia bacterium]|nr:ABC transporter ATP-binding protein [Clostridia bacterium]